MELKSPVSGVKLEYVKLKNGIRLRVASAGTFFCLYVSFCGVDEKRIAKQARPTVRPFCSCTDGPNRGSLGDIR